ncbi:uncharacterized protein G2W53_014059 [Senna tora]|uniref:Uncharacterized protein n=1 Tax=Senna tora TaxID=362788 RepID=A0A834WSF3_9FABA|nr:uncharacterized protein G2W53_014059 [Senna tora]
MAIYRMMVVFGLVTLLACTYIVQIANADGGDDKKAGIHAFQRMNSDKFHAHGDHDLSALKNVDVSAELEGDLATTEKEDDDLDNELAQSRIVILGH